MLELADDDLLPRMSMLLSPKPTDYETPSPALKKPVSLSFKLEEEAFKN